MTKKTTLIILIFLLLFLVVGFFIIFQKTGETGSDEVENSNDGFLSGFFPFGNNEDNEDRPVIIDTEVPPEGSDEFTSGSTYGELQKITSQPVSGYTSSTTENGELFVRFVEKSTGNIFDSRIDSVTSNRVSNTTILAIQEVVWHKNADNFVLRYQDENDVVKTFVANLSEKSTTSPSEIQSTEGFFYSDGILEVVSNPSHDSFLYADPSNPGFRGRVSDYNGNDGVLFTTDFAEWTLSWTKEESIIAYPKPSAYANGFTFTIDTATGKFSKLFGGSKGLSVKPNTGADRFMYSETINNSFITNMFNSNTRKDTVIGLTTLAEKCVWNTEYSHIAYCAVPKEIINAEYPDMWYQGVISFSDTIWELDTENNTYIELVDPVVVASEEIDAIDLKISVDNNYLLFKNKKDSALWSLKLELPTGVEIEEDVEEEEVEKETEEAN